MNIRNTFKIPAFLFVLFTLFSFIAPLHASPINTADSLLNVIDNTLEDTIKVINYIELADLFTYNESEKAIRYAQKAIDVSKKSGYHPGLAKGFERLGNAWFQLGNNNRAAQAYRNAREANKKVGNYQIDASVYYNLGNIQHELANFDSAIYYAGEAGKVFLENNDSVGYAVSLYMKTNGYYSKGFYTQATENGLKALAIFRDKKVKSWEIYTLNALVDIYNVREKYDESLSLLNTCLDYHRETNNQKFIAITYRFMGDVYLNMENYDRAATALDSSYQITDEYGFAQEKCKTMYSLGMLYYNRQQYGKALEMYEEGLQLGLDLDDELFKCSNYLGIGQSYYQLKNYPLALQNLELAVGHAKNIADHHKLSDAYLYLSNSYKATNHAQQALENYVLHKQYSDSIWARENKQQFAEMASKYESDKKEQQINRLQLEKQTTKYRNQRMLVWGILTLVIVLLVLVILWVAHRNNKQLLAREKELDKIKSDFFANISHEFRTPLTLILGPVHDMLKADRAAPFAPQLRMIQKQAQRLLTLINQLLDLSKLDAGKYQLDIASGDFIATLKSSVFSFLSLAEMKNIDLTVDVDQTELCMNYDEEIVQTILNNLLSNAIKFEPNDGVIRVGLDSSNIEKGNSLSFSVLNKGSYITPDVCASIFDRFYQEKSKQELVQGTGIGLALTHELVNIHGGSIRVESSKAEGTRFLITLPSNKPITKNKLVNTKHTDTKPGEHVMISGESEREEVLKKDCPLVLIIEDHIEVLTYISSVFARHYRIETATNGQIGIDKALELIPDIIISDVMMPLKDGMEAVRELKNNRLTSHIPIILLSAKASVENRLEGREAHADAYIAKPFNPDELLLIVKNMLDNRERLRIKYSSELIIHPQNMVVKSLDDAYIEKVCGTIEENIANENFTVAELALAVGVSRSQLHRKLEALTSKSASRFIREYRLKRGYELIKKNTATIAEIAYLVGFGSPGYFGKCFKEYFGITPGEVG
ncbi:Signal transduction histidine kinase [Saccharicrinis carchari]|uniref:histidine kinase n=1 Tax=Saccharicrinis carchari TaxID=1168039 RepID=A0A521F8U9_SACCC|nr:tetratricopeptide repeat protein [Saccharicrinis carchari]SMO92639.1 Signal transduction histidine kinase [Saccharicrinis carchari]